MDWAALAILSILSGKALSFTATLKEASEVIAQHRGLGMRPIMYQNSITPPLLPRVGLSCWFLMACLIAWIWYTEGWIGGVGAIVLSFVASFIAQAIIPPPRGSIVYLQLSANTLANRSANYAKKGDHERAAAAKTAFEQLLEARPDIVALK